jgi:hypothetical protein
VFPNIAKKAWDFVYQRDTGGLSGLSVPTFDEAKTQAREVLERSVANNEWLSVCKGRDLLKSFCMLHQLKYEHFRNMLISRLPAPPPRLSAIFDRILGVT